MKDDAWCATFAEALQLLCSNAEADLPPRLADLTSAAEDAAADPALRQLEPAAAARQHWECR